MLVESWQMSGKLYKMSHWISALCHVGITQGLQTQETNKDKKKWQIRLKRFLIKTITDQIFRHNMNSKSYYNIILKSMINQ